MQATVSHLLMLQKYINSSQRLWKIRLYTALRQCFKRFYNLQYEKTGLKRTAKFFSVDYNAFDTNDMLDLHKYLMKKT